MRDVKNSNSIRWLAHGAAAVMASALVVTAQAAVPGITGGSGDAATFSLQASPGMISQPDGTAVYSWGYGCAGAPSGFRPDGVGGSCNAAMQLPGPTLIVTKGQTVSITLRNNLPAAAGNTSILFPGFDVAAAAAAGETGGCATAQTGVLTTEAAISCAVTYTFTANKEGTHSYYSGTRADLQVEMGLFGALIVLPSDVPAACRAAQRPTAGAPDGESDFRLAPAAYSHASACYDREYLFQLSEIDLDIHRQVEAQKDAACVQTTGCMSVLTEPYKPAYFMVNGRSFPDIAEPNYAVQYPTQPYNGNPHMHPGELVLLRVIGTGRWQHPLHEHGNHVRVLGRDGNLLLTPSPARQLAGPLLFTTTSTPGQTIDGIFQWTGKGLNWDVYAHADGSTTDTCVADANGYYTAASGAPLDAPNYYEWCADHQKPLEAKPFGDVGGGGPVTLPDPTLFAMGPWYGGSPYLGVDATGRAVGATPIPPSGTVANTEGSFSYMWHSHNEREITTNNAFPGGMMMMMLVDSWSTVINEKN